MLVLATLGRDAALVVGVLRTAGINAEPVREGRELLTRVEEEVLGAGPPTLGTVVAADEALGIEWSARLADLLERQPSWSDLPIILLGGTPGVPPHGSMPSVPASATAERLNSRSSVTVVDRPMRLATLVSAVRAALRSRVRQLEVRELIEALRGAQVEAERANRVKGEFLAIMSHELRTPLNAIAGYAELLDSGCYGEVTPEQRQALARMSRAQRHLLGLINDLLNFARVERGRVEYAIEPVSVIEALADVAPLIEPQLQAKGLAYDVVPPQRDLRVAADRDKLRQILVNILSNALKFTPRGGRVGLRVTAPEPDGDGSRRVRIEVTDTGPGIPADKLDTIFDPFVQVRVDPTTAREGTGLGLAISRDLAHGMGGDLRATSAVGQGSTFIIDLPRA